MKNYENIGREIGKLVDQKNKATHSLGFCEDCAREFFRERALKIEVDNPANEYF